MADGTPVRRTASEAAGGRLPPDMGCESTSSTVLMFCVSEGAEPQGEGPEDTPNARVAE